MHIFIVSIQGIRNPKAHQIKEHTDPFRTSEYLSLASLRTKRVQEAR